jgi:hypothetical protein
MDMVREIVEWERDYRWDLCQVEWRCCVQEKKEGRIIFLAILYYP